MQLSHLGHRYTAPSTTILEVDTGLDGQFLGNTYPIYQAQIPAQCDDFTLTYRGVAY